MNQQSLDVIFVLSGGIKLNPITQRYQSLTYDQQDQDAHGLVTGGYLRVLATAELVKAQPELQVVTTSRYCPDQPSHAAVMAQELLDLGVPEVNIHLEESSVSTATELVEMVKMAVRNGWQRVGIITSDYHLERTSEMFKRLKEIITYDDPEFQEGLIEFEKRGCQVEFLSAENILENADEAHREELEKVRTSEAYQKRIVAEQQGIRDLNEGNYRVYKTPLR